MNIAMFTDAYFPRINGVTISVKSYATELNKLGHKVCIVCLEYSEEQQKSAVFDEKSEDEKSPFSVIRIPSMGIIWSKEDRMVRLDKWHFLKEKMQVFQPDIIHINSEWSIGYLGTLYSRKAKIPIVFTFHTFLEEYLMNYVNFIPQGSMQKLGRDIVKFYLKKAEIIIAPTKRIENVVHEYGIEKDTFLLPTGIPSNLIKFDKNQNKYIKAALFKKFPLLKNKNILLYVGRVVKEIAASRGLKKDVAFTGYAAYKDLIYFYKMASVFVFPSLTETQGLVTIEAMTAGLPVVAIGEMGTVDVMRGDNGGFMVSNDVDEFASKVHILLNDKKIYSRKKADAIEWAKRWSIETLTPKLVDCYKKAIDNFKKNHSS